jgi:hypothetical protein
VAVKVTDPAANFFASAQSDCHIQILWTFSMTIRLGLTLLR